jgi:hypothetical protein
LVGFISSFRVGTPVGLIEVAMNSAAVEPGFLTL